MCHQSGLFMQYLGHLLYYSCPQSPLLYNKMPLCGLLLKFHWLNLLYAMYF